MEGCVVVAERERRLAAQHQREVGLAPAQACTQVL